MKRSILDKMQHNPAGDWHIADIEKLCLLLGMRCSPPRGDGSHYRVSHPNFEDVLIIPARKPIKTTYIRQFVTLCKKLNPQEI